jgi:hypothetical protein
MPLSSAPSASASDEMSVIARPGAPRRRSSDCLRGPAGDGAHALDGLREVSLARAEIDALDPTVVHALQHYP